MAIESRTPCINCGGTAFTRNEKLMALVEIDQQGNVQLGASVLPIIALACNSCGAPRLFHPGIAGG